MVFTKEILEEALGKSVDGFSFTHADASLKSVLNSDRLIYDTFMGESRQATAFVLGLYYGRQIGINETTKGLFPNNSQQ